MYYFGNVLLIYVTSHGN